MKGRRESLLPADWFARGELDIKRAEILRGGPHRLDRFGAEIRWKPPSIMPPVASGNLLGADSSMPHKASGRRVTNVVAPRCIC